MSFWRFVVQSLRHYARRNVTVALAAAAATAVLTGALLVGDSVRGSLTDLTLDRLGRIDEALIAERFFRADLANEIAASDAFAANYRTAQPVILYPNATIEVQRDGKVQRTANVLLVGATDDFWDFDSVGVRPSRPPSGDEIVINQALAGQWSGEIGDTVILRLPKPTAIPTDSAYGRKTDTVVNLPDLEVIDVLPNRGLGRFSLHPSQSQSVVAFVPLAMLQSALKQADRANAILIAGNDPLSPPDQAASQALQDALRPQLSDFGFSIDRVRMTHGANDNPQVIFDYFTFESDRMLIPLDAQPIAEKAFNPLGGSAVFTYFVNTIAKKDNADGIPYSMVSGVGANASFDLKQLAGLASEAIQPGDIVLTSWAAEDQNANVNETIDLTYFLPETSHGKATEKTESFRVAGRIPLTAPIEPWDGDTPAIFEQTPTPANDPEFTPTVEGITDRDSIGDLDVPFPFDIRRLRDDKDDPYWKNHRTTPKAYLSYEDAKRIWGSRFGEATSYRIPFREGLTKEQLANTFLAEARIQGATLGMEIQPIKRRGLQASSGTTPFDGLFLGLSMFIIAAALMLVSLLFRLNVEQRLPELGVLLALGLGRRTASRAFVLEGVIVSAIGGIVGVACGVGYAWLMLVGLKTVWVGAIATPFLELHWTTKSLVLGFVSGVVASSLTVYFGVRSASKNSVRTLLAGRIAHSIATSGKATIWRIVAALLFVVSLGLAGYGTQLSGEAQAGCFVGSGAMVLSALVLWTWTALRFGGDTSKRLTLLGLAVRNMSRNPSRSTTTIGLMAVASFLIIAMSALQIEPSLKGVGGFEMMALSSQAIIQDLNDPDAQADLLADGAEVMAGGRILSFRYKPGDDASCRNLYQSTAPQVLGVTDETIAYFDTAENGFVFAGSAASDEMERNNPWRLLKDAPDGGEAIPVILDKNTAAYSLHLMGGVGEEFEAEYDGYGVMKFRVAGLLSGSVLQGRLMIGNSAFETAFPSIGGYRFFLIHSPQPPEKVSEVLEDALGDQGFDTQSTIEALDGLLAVQNTYLSTFQALGSLGLLLGTFGLATVQLRSVFERRGELALMRAEGFRRTRLAWMVMLEHATLLLFGLILGGLAAAVAITPHILATGSGIPWGYLSSVLAAVFVIGLTTGLTSVRATMQAPVIAALRGD